MSIEDNGTIIPSGTALSIKLFHINGGSLGSTSAIIKKLQDHEMFFKERSFYQGFSKIESNGNLVECEYYVGQPIKVYTYKDGKLESKPVFSQGKCKFIINPKEKYLVCRDSSWVVKKGLVQLANALGVEFDSVELSYNAMNQLCKEAEDVSGMTISNMKDHDLTSIQFTGGVTNFTWRPYARMGNIKAVKALIELNTGGMVNARITNKGSMLLYGSRIDRDDIDATIKMILRLAEIK
jgi:hypothetical protein